MLSGGFLSSEDSFIALFYVGVDEVLPVSGGEAGVGDVGEEVAGGVGLGLALGVSAGAVGE